MPEPRFVPPGPVRGAARVPGSKSLTQRALVAAAMAPGRSEIRGGLDAEDPRRTVLGLEAMGATVTRARAADGSANVDYGVIGPIANAREAVSADLGDCGTGARVLLALAATTDGVVTLETSDQLRRRPFGPLLDVLRRFGAVIDAPDGHPPFVVRGRVRTGGEAGFVDAPSSQFASALLLAAPRFPAPVTVRWGDVSSPYVDLTLSVMRAFGAECDVEGNQATVRPGALRPVCYDVEGDASSAVFLLGAAAITGGDCRIPNIPGASRQADVRLVKLLAEVGCSTSADDEGLRVAGRPEAPFDVDLVATSDLVPIVAAIAASVPGRSRIRGVAHVRVKESDRIAAMARGLEAMGVPVEERPDGIVIDGGGPMRSATIDPHDDHRIAMAFAALARAVPGVSIADPDCVGKSFPGFFSALDGLR